MRRPLTDDGFLEGDGLELVCQRVDSLLELPDLLPEHNQGLADPVRQAIVPFREQLVQVVEEAL